MGNNDRSQLFIYLGIIIMAKQTSKFELRISKDELLTYLLNEHPNLFEGKTYQDILSIDSDPSDAQWFLIQFKETVIADNLSIG